VSISLDERAASKVEATFTRVVDNISKGALYAAAATVAPWTALFTVYIFVRKSGIGTFFFVEEYTHYWMVFITCLAFAYTLRTEGHVKIELLGRYFPKRFSHIVEILVTLLALVAVGVFVYYGIQHVITAIEFNIHWSSGVESLQWPFYLWLPIGYGLLGLALLLHLYCSVMTAIRGWAK